MDERSRWAEVKVGAFVLGALLLLVAGTLWVSGSTVLRGAQNEYTVLMKDSGGVQRGDRVRLAGVQIGSVTRVALRGDDEWPVAIEISLATEVVVRTDSRARIATAGLLGSSYLEIDSGSTESTILSPGGDILGEEMFGLQDALYKVDGLSTDVSALLQQTAGIMDQVSKEIGPLMARLEGFLSEENIEHVGSLLAGMDGLLKETGPRVTTLLERLDSLAERLDGASTELEPFIERMSAMAEQVQSALGPDGSRLAGVMEAAESGLSSAGDVMTLLNSHRRGLSTTLTDLRLASENLRDFSQQLKERPFSLVRIKPEKERRPGDGSGKGTR